MKAVTMVTHPADGTGAGRGVIVIEGDEQELGLLMDAIRKGHEYWGGTDLQNLGIELSALLMRIDNTLPCEPVVGIDIGTDILDH
jgi:hypothetical protein